MAGTLHLHPYSDFTHVILPPAERDKLVEGNGSLAVELSGADFEFLDKVSLESSARDAKPVEVGFTLPSGKRAGPQSSVTVNIDTAKRGSYRLLLTQSDGVSHAVAVTVLPPNPKISNLPIRLNMGETHQAIRLEGSGMERIESASSDAGEITRIAGFPRLVGRNCAENRTVHGPELFPAPESQRTRRPITVPDAIRIVGPRPRILSLQKSLAGALGIEIGADELPAGTAAGLVLTMKFPARYHPPQAGTWLRSWRVAPEIDTYSRRTLGRGEFDPCRTGNLVSFGRPRRRWLCQAAACRPA